MIRIMQVSKKFFPKPGSTENVRVQMKNRLPRAGAVIDDEPVVVKFFPPRHRPDGKEQPAQNLRVRRSRFRQP